jgi:ATP-dependent Lon protease
LFRLVIIYLRDIDPTDFEHRIAHVHVPAGAIPKDGPSAGVTILVALASQALGARRARTSR